MWSSFISSHEFSSCICIRTCTLSEADMLILKWMISLRWRWRFETTPLEQTRIFVLRIWNIKGAYSYHLFSHFRQRVFLVFSFERTLRFTCVLVLCTKYRWKVISCVISFSCDSMLRELDAFWVSLSISACYDRAAAREWVPFWIKSDCDRSAAGSQFLETLCKGAVPRFAVFWTRFGGGCSYSRHRCWCVTSSRPLKSGSSCWWKAFS